MEVQLAACVRESLDSFLYQNAAFMCERLYAEYHTEENLLLLATVYIRADQAYRSYRMLKGQTGLSMQGRYLLAQSAYKMGIYDEARLALIEDRGGEVPGGAAGYYLLGKLYTLTDNPAMATSAFSAALMRDPLMWCAYEGLCRLGHNEDAASILRQFEQAASSSQQSTSGHADETAPNSSAQEMQPPQGRHYNLSGHAQAYVPTPAASQQPPAASGKFHPQENYGQNESTPASSPSTSFVTPSPGVVGFKGAAAPARIVAAAGHRESPTPTPMWRGAGRGKNGDTTMNSDCWKFLDEGKLRKVSNRLFSDPASAAWNSPNVTTRRGRGNSNGLGQGVQKLSPNFHEAQANLFSGKDLPIANGDDLKFEEAGLNLEGKIRVLRLLQLLGSGYGHLCRYNCQTALSVFESLPEEHFETAWTMCQIGRACFEMVKYPEAAQAFERARALDPSWLEDMELYSTVLWQLRREIDISHLAQSANALDRLNPRSWCIMGNCFSLQKDQQAALKCFQRALQLDPAFTYAYTLSGHENLALEQFDKSTTCFRNAMRLDPRHYNAWYGLGQIYYRQEKYEMAAYHFDGGLKINGASSVLRCYNGMALAKMNRHEDAIAYLREAIKADAQNPLARFELASVLVTAGLLDDALRELLVLKDKAPKEASVYFQIGKIFRRLAKTDKALLYFSTALDLKPSTTDIGMIKSAIEKLRISADSDDEDM